MNYTEKIYKEARMVAVKAHGNKAYAGIYPYWKHLDDVVDVLKRYGFSGKYIVAAYLHDTLEDTDLSYNKIKLYFGFEVAEMVYGVTDELGRSRKEKKEKTLPKTASIIDAIILKLGDRIANIEMGGKVDMYRDEYEQFRGYLFANSPKEAIPMWNDLEILLKLKEVA
jgi:GTP pyrophosphokinase